VPGGPEWLERLPRLVDECVEQWGLALGPPMAGGYASFVAPAGDAVLKVGFPHEEAEHEALVLRLWAGDGAVRLLDEDPSRNALLLERCAPGTPLLDTDDDTACDVVIGLMPRLWKPPPPGLRHLADLAAAWVDGLPALWEAAGRPFERQLLDAAVSALTELGPSQGPLVIGNEDLHAGNVLRAQREPWLVIDPKPLAAEREFGPVAMIRDVKEHVRGGQLSAERVHRRLEHFSSELGLDRERVRGWTIAHTIAWGFEGDRFKAAHADLARLLLG
jgi:streptomycin 6-kinase